MTQIKSIKKSDFPSLLKKLQEDYSVFVPVKSNNHRSYKEFDGSLENVVLGEVRAFEPLKAFFSRARETVAVGFKKDIPHADDKPLAIIGAKACDLKGFLIQDHVFSLQGSKDPLYIKNREDNLIVSADCTCTIQTCFCRALGVEPFPRENFDINISELDQDYLIEVGSPKGQKIIDDNASLFMDGTNAMIQKRNENRAKIAHEVDKNILENTVPHQDTFNDIIEKQYEANIWEEEAQTCVECGACNTICPTCHCFLLTDHLKDQDVIRTRLWDSCMIKDFARVAGGANPRGHLWMRLRNRFEKKFDFFKKVSDVYACTGCGRCISACPAKIDIRKVLQRLVAGK